MTKKLEVNIGDRFNRLTVTGEDEKHVYPSGKTRRKLIAICDCGTEKSYLINQITSGKTKSCGCFNMDNLTTHGMFNTRQYQCWADMKTRCDNSKNKFYDYYGGRGITYCEKWSTFEGFWEDMHATYDDTLTINRRDNDGNYCKENCEWDTRNFQGHMRRKLQGTKLNVIGGVLNEKSGMISTAIKRDGKRILLGNYATEQEVAEAYDCASEIVYGDRPNKTEKSRESIVEKVIKRLGIDATIHPSNERTT